MEKYSDFQIKFPLSPKKFWKKIISRSISIFIFSAIIGFLIAGAIVGFTFVKTDSVSISGIILTGFLAFIFVFLVILALYAIYVRAYIKRYYYDCANQLITIKKGVFAPTEIHVMYQKIQDVYVDQDILDRIMGLYDVHIASATATSGIEAHIDGVEQAYAEEIKNFILNKIQGGGTGSSNTPNVSNSPTPSPKFISDKKISSENYPIVSAWTTCMVISSIFASLFLSFAIGGLFFFLLFPIILAVWIAALLIWKKNFYFEFMPEYLLLKTGIIGRQEKHLPYKSIQNLIVSQGIIERMFGIATVKIENAAFEGMNSQNSGFGMRINGRSTIGRSSGISLVGQPYEKAQELNQILNQITNLQSDPTSMGL